MKASFDNKGSKVVDRFEELTPTQIPKSELELLLEKAIANDDFRGAIRLYFIFIIKGFERERVDKVGKEKNQLFILNRNERQSLNTNHLMTLSQFMNWCGMEITV